MNLPASGLSIGMVDANPLLADGIAALFHNDPGQVAHVEFLGSTAEAVLTGHFDILIVDPSQSLGTPADLARTLGDRASALLGYSSTVCERLARACIAAGFRGVLPKTVPFETLRIALATTAQGGIFIDAAFAAAIGPDVTVDDSADTLPQPTLSARELSVLKSVAHGKSMKEIGRELDLSSKTVETYKARGSSKLNLSGRRQIVEFAIAQGWVDSTRLTVG